MGIRHNSDMKFVRDQVNNLKSRTKGARGGQSSHGSGKSPGLNEVIHSSLHTSDRDRSPFMDRANNSFHAFRTYGFNDDDSDGSFSLDECPTSKAAGGQSSEFADWVVAEFDSSSAPRRAARGRQLSPVQRTNTEKVASTSIKSEQPVQAIDSASERSTS